jgi:hypothetical protein
MPVADLKIKLLLDVPDFELVEEDLISFGLFF